MLLAAGSVKNSYLDTGVLGEKIQKFVVFGPAAAIIIVSARGDSSTHAGPVKSSAAHPA